MPTIILLLLLSLAQPQPATPPETIPPPPMVEPEVEWAVVTRADLAAAYRRFERVYRSLPDRAERTRQANQAFDRATAAFLGGNMNQAIRAVQTAADTLLAPDDVPPEQALASSLRVTVQPSVYPRTASRAPHIRIEQWYGLDTPARASLRIRLLPIDADEPWTANIEVEATPGRPVDMQVPVDGAWLARASGAYLVSVGVGEQSDPGPLFFCVLTQPAGETHAALKPRIDALEPGPVLSPSALATLRGRLSLLADGFNPLESASFLTPMSSLADTLAAEVAIAEGKRNPFAGRAGLTWRLLDAEGRLIPYVTHVPVGRSGPLPIVVAFHGMGGDEFMFQVGYGDGELRRLADARPFIAVSPRTEPFLNNPALFDALLEELGRDYAIDRTRVYVIGHSMGAGVAGGLASSRPGTVAAAACIAGGGVRQVDRVAPTLILAGQFDPIIPAARLKVGADRAAQSGLPVTYREVPNQGHTLIVGDTLAEVVDWLWRHRLEQQPR